MESRRDKFTDLPFVSDVLDMYGGREANIDLRSFCRTYIGAESSDITLDIEDGVVLSNTLVGKEVYNLAKMLYLRHFLAVSWGSKTVPAARTNNRMLNGKFVIEYDLIKTDSNGDNFIFVNDPAEKHRIETNREDNKSTPSLLPSLTECEPSTKNCPGATLTAIKEP